MIDSCSNPGSRMRAGKGRPIDRRRFSWQFACCGEQPLERRRKVLLLTAELASRTWVQTPKQMQLQRCAVKLPRTNGSQHETGAYLGQVELRIRVREPICWLFARLPTSFHIRPLSIQINVTEGQPHR